VATEISHSAVVPLRRVGAVPGGPGDFRRGRVFRGLTES
jgi:hypothetical protein